MSEIVGPSGQVGSLVARLGLVPHPEGGYYRETHRDALEVPAEALPARFGGPRSAATAIYYLLEQGDFSALHRIASDEVWHHYLGATLAIHVLHTDGRIELIRLGSAFERGEVPQAVVPAGAWFGSRVADAGAFALVGCTVAPGFDFADFELGSREALLAAFPDARDVIVALTRASDGG